MKSVARVLCDGVKPEAHGHVIYSALQLSQRYEAFASVEKKEWGSIKDDSSKVGSESEEDENVELWSELKVKNSEIPYILVYGNYEKLAIPKPVAHKIVVDTTMPSLQSEAPWRKLLYHVNY